MEAAPVPSPSPFTISATFTPTGASSSLFPFTVMRFEAASFNFLFSTVVSVIKLLSLSFIPEPKHTISSPNIKYDLSALRLGS